MKDLLLAALTLALSALCSYGMIAFALYEFDAGKWPTDARVICMTIAAVFAAAATEHHQRQRK